MAVDVDRDRRALVAATNIDDAATEEDFLCALRKCVVLLAGLTAIGVWVSVPGIYKARDMVLVCCNATALAASGYILLKLGSKVIGTRGIRYSQLHFIIILDVLGLIGAYSAASVKTSISVVTSVAAVLLYVAIQVLLFLSKPVGRLLPDVQETPPPKCLKFQKRVRRQHTMVVSTEDKVKTAAAVKSMILSLTIFTSAVYELRVGPLPSADSGDTGTRIMNPMATELVYFHWNDTASVASLMFILLCLLSRSFSKQRILYCALQVAMTLDLFAFVVASASRNCLQLPTFVYISVLAPVSLYAGIMAMVSMSEKMEQYCVPNWLTKSFELSTNGHTEDTRQTRGWNLEDIRQLLLFLTIGIANAITNEASMSLSQLQSRPGHVVDSWAFHFNEFYVGNLTDQADVSPLSSLRQENTSGYVIGNLNLAFYCYATAFTGFLAIIVLLASTAFTGNKKTSSRGIQYYALRLSMVLQLLCLVGALADRNHPKKSMVDIFRDSSVLSVLLVTIFILLRGSRKTVQSILGWLQHTLRVDPSEEEGSQDELEIGLAGGGTNGEPIAVEISAPVLGGAFTLVLAIPVMRMLASPVKMFQTFVVAIIGADLSPRLLARLLRALARALHRRCIPGQGSAPTRFGATSWARRGWYMVLATCHGLCKMIQMLCSKACVWILVFVIWFPSLKSNLKLKFKIPKISALVGLLIALATTAKTTTTMDSPTTATTATGTCTSATATTASGTTSRRRKHQPRVEARPRRNCRPNTRLISEEWVN